MPGSLIIDHPYEGVMAGILDILLQSGRSAVELALYILLPVMVVMMAFMKLLEAKKGLDLIEKRLTPVLHPLGIPGIGIFAILQSLLVSFAAPVATLKVMENNGTPARRIAATLAMVLAISQANVVFPMLTVGLNLWMVLATSLVGGVVASTLTYYYFARSEVDEDGKSAGERKRPETREKTVLSILEKGGREGVLIALKAIPILVLSLCLVNSLKAAGVISFFESTLSPVLNAMRLPESAVSPIATKFLAGGTAMMGVTINLIKDGLMTPLELNRIAGLVINPLDLVGVAVLKSAGPRVASVIWSAIKGATVGILIRSLLHYLIF